MIEAVIFSYKSKNLKKSVDQLLKNTSSKINIMVFDQNPINRKGIFNIDEYTNKASYNHVVWDEINGPAHYKADILLGTNAEYFLILSDDIFVSKDWDKHLIDFLQNKKAIVSGTGELKISQKNLFFLEKNRANSENYTKTNFIDRNFIFGKSIFLKDSYPTNLKYNGEEESLSLNLFNSQVEIFSAPTSTYEDAKIRTIENKYVPFSLEHNYNSVIDLYDNAPENFLKSIGIEKGSLHKLPYTKDDVSYHPYRLEFQELDARKFIMNVKEIS
jgi:hypothetical protein